MEANLYLVPPNNLMWCCDVASRLNNDIQSLAHDLQILFKLQMCYKGLHKQYDQLFKQLETRLEMLSSKKLQHSSENEIVTPKCAEEFIIFIRRVWVSLSDSLDNENGKARFISYVRGVPLKTIVDELMNFCFHCSRTLLPRFHHHQCSQVFLALSSQLNSYIFPEVEFVDSFEQSLKYLTSSMPCLINLLTIIDLYTYSPKYSRIESLCNDLFTTTPPPEPSHFFPIRLLQLPDPEDYQLISEDVDYGYISYWVPKMVSYILKMSVVPRRFSTIHSQPRGVLTSPYMSCTEVHQLGEVYPGQERRRRGRSAGRRGYNKDLNPIKVPRLSMQPFAY